jgi:hypothetical protein
VNLDEEIKAGDSFEEIKAERNIIIHQITRRKQKETFICRYCNIPFTVIKKLR